MRLAVASLSLTFLLAGSARAEERWIFHPYPSPEGRPLERVRDLATTEDGTVWVATWGSGVHAIRGTKWDRYESADGLPGDWTRSIVADGQNGVWVATADGLAHIRDRVISVYTRADISGLHEDSLTCVRRLKNGAVWVGTEHGYLYSFHPRFGGHHSRADEPRPRAVIDDWKLVVDPKQSSGQDVEDVLQTHDGTIWVALDSEGVLESDGDEWIHHNADRGVKESTRRLFEDSRGTLWAAGSLTLFRREQATWSTVSACPQPYCFGETADGRLLVGIWNGVRVLEEGRWEDLKLGMEAGALRVRAIGFRLKGEPKEKRKGDLWLGAKEGLVLGMEPAWRQYNLSPGDGELGYAPFAATPDQAPIALDASGNVVVFENEGWKTVCRLDDHGSCEQWFQEPVAGQSWAYCKETRQVIRFSVTNGKISQCVSIPVRRPHGLFQTSGGELWIFAKKGIFALRDCEWQPLPLGSIRAPHEVNAIDEAPDGSIYVCYTGDAERWTGDRVELLRKEHPDLADEHFGSVCCLRDGRVWFGVYGSGILVYDGTEVERMTTKEGLLSDHVSTIFEASDGTIWIGYREKGLASYRDGHWVNFTHRHRIPSYPVRQIGEHPKGTIWAAIGFSGIFRHPPDTEGPEAFIRPHPSEIPHRGVGIFSVGGTDAWHRTASDDLRFSWRIRSAAKREPAAWSPFEKETSIVTERLPSGEYRFEVLAMDEDRNVDAEAAWVSVRVAPPFWLTAGFLLPVAILSMLAMISLIISAKKHAALRQSEEELRHSEASLAEAQRIAHLGNWEWHPQTGKVRWSEEVYRIFGLWREEFGGDEAAFLSHVHPEDRQKVEALLKRAALERTAWSIDHRIVLPDDEVRVVHVEGKVVTGLTGVTGQTERIIGTIQDITERKRNEEERLLLESQIQQGQKLESIGLLAGGIAHDFNNLLMGVLGNAGLALLELPESSATRQKVEDIETAAIRLSELTNQLLAYSGKGKFVIESVRLSDLVKEMTRLLRTVISKSADLQFDIDEDTAELEADATQIRQLVMNLITNASESLEGQAGRITLKTSQLDVDRTELAGFLHGQDLPEGCYVRLEVSDTGCGMTSEMTEKIFDPFVTTKFTGRGLGLAATLGIVRGHHGAIKVESRPGRGSKFTVLLPVPQSPRATTLDSMTPESVRTGDSTPEERDRIATWEGQGTVLVADDEESVREVIKLSLERYGLDVLLASDGNEAVEAFRRHHRELQAVLLDITMPHKDGYETYQEMREISSSVPIILSSGYTEEEVKGHFEGDEFLNGFLQKPYSSIELLVQLRKLLGTGTRR